MLIIDEELSKTNPVYSKIEEYYDPRDIIMFDIETTGLSASSSFIYLIGVNYYKDGTWHITQYFNDDGRSEPQIIETFMEFILDYKYLLTFNGNTFDIPYVSKRLESINDHFHMNIRDNFSRLTKIDLYKMIRPYKASLGLSNLKQKTIERFVGLNRIDQMNGGQLIEVYFDYLSTDDARSKSLVLQHNRDDMDGMFYLADILALKALSEGEFSVADLSMSGTERLKLKISLDLKHFPDMDIASMYHDKNSALNKAGLSSPLLMISSDERKAYISLPVEHGVFIHFYEDYKNYNYYPELDEAFHKDLAPTLTEYKCEKAKALNCYTKLEGFFVKKYKFTELESYYSFDETSSGTASKNKLTPYAELTDDFLGNEKILNSFARYTVKTILGV